MARAADYVVAEARQIVKTGELDPELVTIPGIFIDAIVQSEDVYINGYKGFHSPARCAGA